MSVVKAARLNIVSIYYWPEQTGIGPYTAAVAEHFAFHGYTVNAVVGYPHFPQWRATGTAHRQHLIHNGVAVHRHRHYVPERHNAFRRALYELSFGLDVLLDRALPAADFTIAVVPNLTAGYAAVFRRRRCGPFGVIVQDLSSQAASQSGTPGGRSVSAAARGVEGWIFRRAEFIAVVSEAFRAPVEAMGVRPDRIVGIRNWTRLAAPVRDRAAVRTRMGWADGDIIALHSGNMGRKQALDNVVAAARLADAQGSRVRFVLMGDGNQRFELEALARGVQHIAIIDPQPDDWFADVLAAADVLLVNERASVRDMSLPSKLTSYFASGRPVVAAVLDGGSTATELHRAGAGVRVNPETPGDLLETVEALGRDSGTAASLGDKGRRYAAEELGPRQTLESLQSLVEKAVGR
jgi:colanic acid biosynthesis glycosyl transferase WcaI